MKEGIAFCLIFFTAVSFMVGILVQSIEPRGCEYRTVGSRINLGYIAGCEISKERW
jgi:hypothetical protein